MVAALTSVEMCDAQHPPEALCGPEGLLRPVTSHSIEVWRLTSSVTQSCGIECHEQNLSKFHVRSISLSNPSA